MARLTEKKMERWEKELIKARKIINSINIEVNDVHHEAKSGRASFTSPIRTGLADVDYEIMVLVENVDALRRHENRFA